MSRFDSWPLRMIATAAIAIVTLPALASAQPSNVMVTIDAPANGVTISNGYPVEITGWALDTSATDGTGIEAVEILLEPQPGAGSQRLFAVSRPRPDVAVAFDRSDWVPSGFSFSWTPQGLSNGEHTVQVWAYSTQGISRFASVTLMAAPRLAARPTDVAPLATPTVTSMPGLRVGSRLGCDIDVTLIAPATFSRPCPTPSPSPSPTPN